MFSCRYSHDDDLEIVQGRGVFQWVQSWRLSRDAFKGGVVSCGYSHDDGLEMPAREGWFSCGYSQ